jgi:cell division control protein 6
MQTDIFGMRRKIFKNREVLASTYIPQKIIHRDSQLREIAHYLSPALDKATPPPLIITGPTGSGKSVTLFKILTELRERVGEGVRFGYTVTGDTKFQTLTSLARDTGLYAMPLRGIGFGAAWEMFRNYLGDSVTILSLDEIDKMMKADGQDLLYYLSRRPHTCVIGISNKLTVMEMVDDPRVRSSFMPRRIAFPPYNADELLDILRERVGEAFYPDVLAPQVLPLCAAMAAQRNGDARYALDLLTMAGEVAIGHGCDTVLEEHVTGAKQSVESAFIRKSVSQLRKTQKLLLYSTLKHDGKSPTIIYRAYNAIASKCNLEPLSSRRLAQYMGELELCGLVDVEKRGKGRGMGFQWRVFISSTIDKPMLEEILKENFEEE